MPEHQEIAEDLMKRFPGWRAWLGASTRTWWAMAPAELRIPRLLQSPTAGGLAVQIAQHAQPKKPAEHGSPECTEARFGWRLDEDPQPVRLARRMVDATLTAWNACYWLENARLVASELVTNADSHGEPPITMILALLNGTSGKPALLIEVADSSTKVPAEREPGESGGFGMSVLGALAEVTIHIHPGGKSVRAVIPEPSHATASTASAGRTSSPAVEA